MVTATAFGKDGVSFFENGVVSLNLPPVANVLGTRATRTTHPQTLNRFGRLFSRIFETPLRVDNPFFWRTKTEIVSTIARLGMSNEIAHTRSCADVHNQTKQHPHCGRCSQCIDRRFAMLAAGLERFDHAVDYRTDLMEGVRMKVQEKEVALSYVRNALGFETINAISLEQHFPEILNVIEYLNEPVPTALARLADLLKRHGRSVSGVMREFANNNDSDQFAKNSLMNMFGKLQRDQTFGVLFPPAPEQPVPTVPEKFRLTFDQHETSVLIDGAVKVSGNATFELLLILAKEHLRGAGQGMELLDYPTISTQDLKKLTGLSSEEAVRRRVLRARSYLGRKFSSAAMDGEMGQRLIENLPWHGYRLASDLVEVRMR